MPAVVSAYLPKQNLSAVRRVQRRLISDYEQDFSKHAPTAVIPRIRMVWDGIPLKAYRDIPAFKLYLVDVGLLAAMTDLDAKTLLQG